MADKVINQIKNLQKRICLTLMGTRRKGKLLKGQYREIRRQFILKPGTIYPSRDRTLGDRPFAVHLGNASRSFHTCDKYCALKIRGINVAPKT